MDKRARTENLHVKRPLMRWIVGFEHLLDERVDFAEVKMASDDVKKPKNVRCLV